MSIYDEVDAEVRADYLDSIDFWDDDDRAYSHSVDEEMLGASMGMDYDPNMRITKDYWSDLNDGLVIPGVPENHVPGQMDVFDFLGSTVEYCQEYIPF